MKVIELFGMSRAGKTTQIRALSDRLRKIGLNFTSFKPKTTFRESGGLERFHIQMYRDMQTAYRLGLTTGLDFLIFDRGFNDRLVLLTRDLEDQRVSAVFSTELM